MNNFTWCQTAYNNKWATKDQLQVWVSTNNLTSQDYYAITKDTAYLKALVTNEKMTKEEYKTTTGIDHVA